MRILSLKITFIIALLFTSCSERQYSEKNPNTSLTISYELPSNEISTLYNVIENYHFVKLQTKNAPTIGEVGKIIIYLDNVLLHNVNANVIEIFDANGKYLRTIGTQGEGPGELVSLRDFIVTQNGEVILLDGERKKIIRYNFDGKFLNDQKLEFFSWKFEQTNSGYVFLSSGSSEYYLHFTDFHFNEIAKARPKRFKRTPLLLKNLSVSSGSSVLYSEILCDTLFRINGTHVIPYLYFDFEEKSSGKLSQADIKEKFSDNTGKPNYRKIRESYLSFPSTVSETNTHLSFFALKSNKGYFVIMDKATKKMTHFNVCFENCKYNTPNDLTFTESPLTFNYASSNLFISVLSPEKLTIASFDPKWSNDQKKRYLAVKDLTADIDEKSNPILLLAKFKPIIR